MDVATLRTFITTTLEDSALQTYLSAAELDVARTLGPHISGDVTEYLPGGLSLVRLGRPAAALTSVTVYPDTDDEATLDEDDTRLSLDGTWLERLNTGTEPAYVFPSGARVKVAYTVLDDQPIRDRGAVLLVALDVSTKDPLMTQENIDGYGYQRASNSAWNYGTVRQNILDSLKPDDAMRFA